MSVVGRPFSQRTGNYVVIANYFDTDTIYSNAYLMLVKDFDQWVSDNKSLLTVVGNTYTSSVANFSSIMNNVSNGIYENKYYTLPNRGQLPIGMELKDMGKDAFIGVPGEANLLRLRLVQLPGTVANLGKGGAVGYIPIEANADIFDGASYPNLSVARL